MAAHQSSEVFGAPQHPTGRDAPAWSDCVTAVAPLDLAVREPAVAGWYERYGKRALDVVGASLLLLVVSPVVLLIMVVLRFSLGPGIFFTQERVGKGGRTFRMLKFRTMDQDRRSQDVTIEFDDRRRTHKSTDDPRHTPVGRLLRRTSLDELPQVVNVVRGDMSLVGPRPELVSVAHRYGILNHPRHRVRPGITGPWQVSALRSAGDLNAGLAIDEQYVTSVSLVRDGSILLRTVGAVVRSTGS